MQEDTAQSRSILIAGPLLDTALLSAGLVEDPRSASPGSTRCWNWRWRSSFCVLHLSEVFRRWKFHAQSTHCHFLRTFDSVSETIRPLPAPIGVSRILDPNVPVLFIQPEQPVCCGGDEQPQATSAADKYFHDSLPGDGIGWDAVIRVRCRHFKMSRASVPRMDSPPPRRRSPGHRLGFRCELLCSRCRVRPR